MAYPASSQYELDLSEGEVILLLKRREDGWCKGTVEGTNRTGLFPANFVQKLWPPNPEIWYGTLWLTDEIVQLGFQN